MEMVRVGNPFELITTDPVKLILYSTKSKLVIIITEYIHANGLSQKDAAAFFGVTQPRISNLLKGQLAKFSIDCLLEMVVKTGSKVDFDFNPKSNEFLSIHLRKGLV